MYSPGSQISHGIRHTPLPNFSWADARDVWTLMVKKDELYVRRPELLSRHPTLQPRMRSILFDWLSEVCEVYKLHRETYYLALDFIDRYLSKQQEVPKTTLQLIGISCLFIASKIEEIYPPKLSEFAYVTDGACTEDEIQVHELVILKTLNWDLTPMTVNSWLSVYLQLYAMIEKSPNKARTRSSGDAFMVAEYPSQLFANIAHLLDLSMLDIGSLQYSYSAIAAAALYHFTSEAVIQQCTGFTLDVIKECVIWMTPFGLAIREEGLENPKLQKSPESTQSLHNIQTHTADLTLLEKAHLKQQESLAVQLDPSIVLESSEVLVADETVSDLDIIETSSPGRQPHIKLDLLTPPRSSSKHSMMGEGDCGSLSDDMIKSSSNSGPYHTSSASAPGRRADKRRSDGSLAAVANSFWNSSEPDHQPVTQNSGNTRAAKCARKKSPLNKS